MGIWSLNSFLIYSWISPPVIHKFQNSTLVVATFRITRAFFWLLTVCAVYVFEVMLVSPCFETPLPFSSVTQRSPLWGIVMLGVLPSCESCSDHLVCPDHTESGPSTQLTQPLPLEVYVIHLNVVRPRFCDTFLVAAPCAQYTEFDYLCPASSLACWSMPKFSK